MSNKSLLNIPKVTFSLIIIQLFLTLIPLNKYQSSLHLHLIPFSPNNPLYINIYFHSKLSLNLISLPFSHHHSKPNPPNNSHNSTSIHYNFYTSRHTTYKLYLPSFQNNFYSKKRKKKFFFIKILLKK
jgi:hypothetical protein